MPKHIEAQLAQDDPERDIATVRKQQEVITPNNLPTEVKPGMRDVPPGKLYQQVNPEELRQHYEIIAQKEREYGKAELYRDFIRQKKQRMSELVHELGNRPKESIFARVKHVFFKDSKEGTYDAFKPSWQLKEEIVMLQKEIAAMEEEHPDVRENKS